jgi:hypothetical protein
MAFFNKSSVKSESKQDVQFIHVGNESFHALAVALIDALKHGARLNDESSKKIVDNFSLYYPKLLSVGAYLTPTERLNMLVNNHARKSELVDAMAYILRQLAVDVLLAEPVRYQDAFEGFTAKTSQSHLREPTTSLPVSALIALTESLGLTLNVWQVAHGKEVRLLERHENEQQKSPKIALTLQVQGDILFPKVKDKREYAYVGHLPVKTVPNVSPTPQSDTLAPLLEHIAMENKQVLTVYEQTRKTLLSMVAANELSKQQLLAGYVSLLPKKSRVYTDAFFSKLQQTNTRPATTLSFRETQQQKVGLLINSLARWVSSNQINEDQLFDSIEQVKNGPKTPVALS